MKIAYKNDSGGYKKIFLEEIFGKPKVLMHGETRVFDIETQGDQVVTVKDLKDGIVLIKAESLEE